MFWLLPFILLSAKVAAVYKLAYSLDVHFTSPEFVLGEEERKPTQHAAGVCSPLPGVLTRERHVLLSEMGMKFRGGAREG